MASKSKKRASSQGSKRKKKTKFKTNILIIFFLCLGIFLIGFGYFLGQKREIKDERVDVVLEKNVISLEEKRSKPKVSKQPISHQERKPKKQKVETKKSAKASENTLDIHKTQLAYRGKKPKLVIIIDDIHHKNQLAMIQKLPMKLTPSIFPPYPLARESHLLAKNLKHYMIHLPMESSNKKLNTQSKTLMVSFSDEQIADRIMEIRRLFPMAKYINNHTGSIFTSNYTMMKKLYIALRLEGFVFVDSLTHTDSKIKKIAHEFGDVYVARDIFLDNKQRVKYIHRQLKKAVSIAKKKGYAIAIGHPHKVTIQALKYARSILKDVEVVYIDEIFRRD